MLRVPALATLISCATTLAFAQGVQTGTIRGVVKDAQQLAVPGVTSLIVAALTHLLWAWPSSAQDALPVLEIRVYTLKAGVRSEFHARFLAESLPLLRRAGVDVVAFGPSQHDQDSYYLMRAFPSLPARERAEAAFYSSRAWLDGPRDAVLAAIQTYSTVVIAVDPSTLKGLRMSSVATSRPAAEDLAALVRLNQDYIDAVRTSNVQRFREILAEDFLCTMADGTLVDRTAFLEHAGRPTVALELEAHDVNVRLLGDFAIVHAATTFKHPDGRPGRGRYTDVWAHRDGRWVAVAAQFARR